MPARKRVYETVHADLLPRLHDTFNDRSEDGESEGTLLFLLGTLNFHDATQSFMFLHSIYVIICLFNSFFMRVLSSWCSMLLLLSTESDRSSSSGQEDKDEYVPFVMSSVFGLLLFIRHLLRAVPFYSIFSFDLFHLVGYGVLWCLTAWDCFGICMVCFVVLFSKFLLRPSSKTSCVVFTSEAFVGFYPAPELSLFLVLVSFPIKVSGIGCWILLAK